MIPTLIGITFITFMIMKLAPGDPTQLKLMFAGEGLSPDALAALLKSEEPPLKLPQGYEDFIIRLSSTIHGRKPGEAAAKEDATYRALKWLGENTLFYLKWLGNIVRLDFGRSQKDKRPVTDKILDALPVTLLINLITIFIIYTVSIPLGIWSALRKGAAIDQVVMVFLFVMYSLPTFWIATMLLALYASGDYFNLFPMIGITSDNFDTLDLSGKILDIAWHLVLPVIASTIGGFAFLTRFARSNFLDVIGQDYIRTAWAKGLPRRRVLFKHGLRNALIPFVTLVGTLLPGLLGGSVIIEQIFSIPGMGMLAFEAVLVRDHNMIMAIATIGAFLTLLGLLISDLMYVIVDPRIRLE